jgi:hypothetical protein
MVRGTYGIGHRAFSLPVPVAAEPADRAPVAPVALEGRLVGVEAAGVYTVIHLRTGDEQIDEKVRAGRLVNRRVRVIVEEIEG